jgi:uncharacterized spore protein YtfJ
VEATLEAGGFSGAKVFDHVGAVMDALSVRRVFGEAYEVGGATVIPVAAVRGGGGGGGGEGQAPDGEGSGTGAGMGFGVSSRALGVYVVKDGSVTWLPAVDVTRLALGGLLVGALAIQSLRRVLTKRG